MKALFLIPALIGLLSLRCNAPGVATPARAAETAVSSQQTAKTPTAITDCDTPFLFTYGTWEKRATIESGRAILRADGITPRGGGGCNVNLDLSGAENLCPVLKVRVGAKNTMKVLRLLLKTADEKGATYDFELPDTGSEFVLVYPKEGATLKTPTTIEKAGMPDLKQIMQWQLIGDWSSDAPVDLEVESVLLLAPDAKAKEGQAARTKRDGDTATQQQQERDALKTKFGQRSALSPTVEAVYAVAPDVLAVQIQAGQVVPAKMMPYMAQAGDARREDNKATILQRGGKDIGYLIGLKKNTLVTFEFLKGDPLLDDPAGRAETYKLRSNDDGNFGAGVTPTAVYRKSKPNDWAQPSKEFAFQHTLYLKLPKALTPGKTYTLNLGDLNVQKPEVTVTWNPATVRSEAVHINQMGYRPDDPVKRAFLSVWMGTGGPQRYPDNLTFAVVDDKTGKSVYTGKVEIALPADGTEKMFRTENFTKTEVCRMDFSAMRTSGRYRVVVNGIGCSYPFEVGAGVWTKAFQTQLRGLFHNRSGVALGPPYTTFNRPRDFYPGDMIVHQSTYSALDKGGEAFKELVAGDTGKTVPEAWGGYQDAGDWNPRRVTHLKVTMAQLEMFELYPTFFKGLILNIPKKPGIPDILTEALFELDLFRRLQLPDGGVRFGIETDGDPIAGEVSWNQSMTAYVYAPDILSSYYYAGVAGRMAKLLAPYDSKLASVYRTSALKAMAWGEKDRAKRKANGTYDKLSWEVKDYRNFSAIVLYDLTDDKHWHDVFLEDTVLKDSNPNLFAWSQHVQCDAAFAYARLKPSLANPALQKNAVAGLEKLAKQALDYAGGNAFNITTSDKGKPMFLGFYSTPDAIELCRAHFLTHKPEYLAGAIQACQFQMGCNPNNMTYTTGLGANPVKHPLKLDARNTGQAAPAGLTVYGNCDYTGWKDNSFFTWPVQYYLGTACKPSAYDWPLSEAYFDIFLYPAMNEYTVDSWAPNVYVWGYLAARK